MLHTRRQPQSQQQQQQPTKSRKSSPRKERRLRISSVVKIMDSITHPENGSRPFARIRRKGTHESDQGQSSQTPLLTKQQQRNIRRTMSADPRVSSGSRGKTEAAMSSSTTRQLPPLPHDRLSLRLRQEERKKQQARSYAYSSDHSGDKDCFETYSFWSSKPALIMFGCVGLAITCDVYFAYGALMVFLYQVSVVISKWKGFIVNHRLVTDCVKVTQWWIRYGVSQAEKFLDENDRTRKAAFGVFLLNLDTTANVIGGYLQQRKAEVTKRTLAEAQRLRDRLHNATS